LIRTRRVKTIGKSREGVYRDGSPAEFTGGPHNTDFFQELKVLQKCRELP